MAQLRITKLTLLTLCRQEGQACLRQFIGPRLLRKLSEGANQRTFTGRRRQRLPQRDPDLRCIRLPSTT